MIEQTRKARYGRIVPGPCFRTWAKWVDKWRVAARIQGLNMTQFIEKACNQLTAETMEEWDEHVPGMGDGE